MRKSFLAIVLGLLVPFAASADIFQVIVDGKVVTFNDVETNAWYTPFIRDATEAKIISGYKDDAGNSTGKFGPADNVTVAQALKIATEGANYNEELYLTVPSGVAGHWASVYVSLAKAEGFSMFTSGNIDLDRPATRSEVAKIFTDAFVVSVATPVGNRYGDVSASTKYGTSIEALTRDGVVAGDTDVQGHSTGTFRPADPINRAEVVKMIIAARRVYGTEPRGRTGTHVDQPTTHTVTYGSGGFFPAQIAINQGDIVTFVNESPVSVWIASNPHPTHTDYPEFNSGRAYVPGEKFSFAFARLGQWGYHNHLKPSETAVVIVK